MKRHMIRASAASILTLLGWPFAAAAQSEPPLGARTQTSFT